MSFKRTNSLIVERARKGFHVYVWLWNTVENEGNDRRAKQIYRKLQEKLLRGARMLPRTSEKVFGNTFLKSMKGNFCSQRRRIARKLGNPRIQQITFHTLRHWKATTLYHRTKDILYVMNFLRHKKIDNTLIYVQLDNAIFGSAYDDELTVKVAKTIKEACELAEAGFQYVTEVDGAKIFRKRK